MKHHADLILSLGCASEHIHCLCGKLIARLVNSGIQLKCKRCRRLMTIPFSHIEGMLAKLLN
jgi:hypothetical protein